MKLNRLPLSARVNLLAVPLLIMGVAVALLARHSLRHNSADLVRAREVKELAVRSLALLLTQDDASKTMMIDPDNTAAGTRKIQAYDDSRAVFARMSELAASDDLRRLMDRLDSIDKQQLRPLDTELLEAMGAGEREAAKGLYLGKYEPVRTKYEDTLRELVNVAERDATAAAASVDAQNDRSVREICLALAIGTILAIGAVSLCAHHFVCLPVRRMGAEMLAVAEGGTYDRELETSHRAGEFGDSARAFNTVLRAVRENIAALRDANQNLEERVQARTHELERASAKTAAVQRASLDSVFVLDAEWKVIEFNAAAERAFGLGHNTILGGTLSGLFVHPPGSASTGFLQLDDGTPFGQQFEVTAMPTDGIPFPAEVAMTSADSDGPSLYVVSVRDISERKRAEAERDELNARLLTASRHAGMAEVATGVLHNVGNVLNTVNTSASMVARQLKDSEVPTLAKLSQMVGDHAGDIATFLTADERGRMVPSFLSELAQCLAQEQELILAEVQTMATGIEHIRQVIGAQQSLAKGGVVRTPTEPVKLMEAAVSMQADSLARHSVTVVRKFALVAPLPLDKHKVLQILINLLSNAQRAARDGKAEQPTVTLSIDTVLRGEQSYVRFQISDNGVGIAPEQLTKIFSHGFTTKEDGHGFGLHSAVNAAREMKGALDAASEGLGKGATFTLQIPTSVEEVVQS